MTVTTRPLSGSDGLIPSQYRSLHKDVRAGERILLDDGKLELRVQSVNVPRSSCGVIEGAYSPATRA